MVAHARCRKYQGCSTLACFFVIVVCFGKSNLRAADLPKNPAPHPAVIDAIEKDAVLAAMPHVVNVCGTVSQIKDSDGNLAINFNGTEQSQFYAVVLKRNREAVEKVHGEGLKSLDGRKFKSAERSRCTAKSRRLSFQSRNKLASLMKPSRLRVADRKRLSRTKP